MDVSLVPILVGIIPSIGVGLLFWYVMRTIVRADRNERAAIAAQEAAQASGGENSGRSEGPAADISAE